MTKDEIRERLVELVKRAIIDWEHGDVSERIADHLLANGVTVQEWIPASEPPKKYRDEHGGLIPFLVCTEGYEYSFRALYDGKGWGDGVWSIEVTHWMPLPQAPKED